MMFCYSKTRKIKYFLDPPPPKKGSSICEQSRYVYMHQKLSIPAACDLDITDFTDPDFKVIPSLKIII